MSGSTTHLDKAFVEQQRQRLIRMRAELLRATNAVEGEETDLRDRFVQDAQELEDDSQRLNILENDDALLRRNTDRLRTIERALQKIEDGTYGLSDLSNKPISRDRLDAIPEATLAKGEEASDGL